MRISTVIAFCLLILIDLCPAQAAEARAGLYNPPANVQKIRRLNRRVEFQYQVFGGGFSVVNANFNIRFSKGSYQATSIIEPRGIGLILAAGRFDSLVSGHITNRGIRPRSYISNGTGQDTPYRVTMKWNNARQLRVSARPGLAADRLRDVKSKLRAGMPDPLSALLAGTIYDTRRPCRGKRRIFDGHMIWDLRYRFIKLDHFGKTGSNRYSGPAYKCMVKYAPVAGYSKKTMQMERSSPLPYLPVWFAPVNVGNAAMLLPIKVIFPTKWIDAVVHLTRARINGRTVRLSTLGTAARK
ncbi:MAG: hypothetical protein C0605_04170 [Hyphomicrobiales bacterium]|nr:MAG: hypothetical protein C0605_04170 [Hyphomicrobiales bacterium]